MDLIPVAAARIPIQFDRPRGPVGASQRVGGGYRWTARTLISTNLLVNEATGPVAVTRWRAGNAVVTPTPAATATDTAVAVALCVGLDADALHILRLLAP